jgi:hypothetical protein
LIDDALCNVYLERGMGHLEIPKRYEGVLNGGVLNLRKGGLATKGGGGRSPRREQRPLVAPGWACRKRHLRPMINKSDKVLRFKAVKL